MAWAADNKTVFFVQEDATTKRADRLFRLTLGSAPVEIYHEPVEQFNLGVGNTRDMRFVELSIEATDTSETRLLPMGRADGHLPLGAGPRKGPPLCDRTPPLRCSTSAPTRMRRTSAS
ncbi:hypothetical protein LP420_21785 [Massilia sp. B-10]|nr:hypothetical protein LP420_21785 [Massilia sp. B-10]